MGAKQSTWAAVARLESEQSFECVRNNFENLNALKYRQFSMFLQEKLDFEIGCKLSATQNGNVLILPVK